MQGSEEGVPSVMVVDESLGVGAEARKKRRARVVSGRIGGCLHLGAVVLVSSAAVVGVGKCRT